MGQWEKEESEPLFNTGVPMELNISIIWVQSSRNKSAHRISLRSCLVWPEAEASDVPGVPWSALFRVCSHAAHGGWTRPPGLRAAPPARAAQWRRLGTVTQSSHLTCACPSRSNSPAIFNPLTVVSPSAGWLLLLCQSCASSPSSRTYAPFPCPALASSSPSSYSSAGSPRLSRPRAKRLHAQPSTRGTARAGRQLKGGRLGRYGRSFSCENHDPGGPE